MVLFSFRRTSSIADGEVTTNVAQETVAAAAAADRHVSPMPSTRSTSSVTSYKYTVLLSVYV